MFSTTTKDDRNEDKLIHELEPTGHQADSSQDCRERGGQEEQAGEQEEQSECHSCHYCCCFWSHRQHRARRGPRCKSWRRIETRPYASELSLSQPSERQAKGAILEGASEATTSDKTTTTTSKNLSNRVPSEKAPVGCQTTSASRSDHTAPNFSRSSSTAPSVSASASSCQSSSGSSSFASSREHKGANASRSSLASSPLEVRRGAAWSASSLSSTCWNHHSCLASSRSWPGSSVDAISGRSRLSLAGSSQCNLARVANERFGATQRICQKHDCNKANRPARASWVSLPVLSVKSCARGNHNLAASDSSTSISEIDTGRRGSGDKRVAEQYGESAVEWPLKEAWETQILDSRSISISALNGPPSHFCLSRQPLSRQPIGAPVVVVACRRARESDRFHENCTAGSCGPLLCQASESIEQDEDSRVVDASNDQDMQRSAPCLDSASSAPCHQEDHRFSLFSNLEAVRSDCRPRPVQDQEASQFSGSHVNLSDSDASATPKFTPGGRSQSPSHQLAHRRPSNHMCATSITRLATSVVQNFGDGMGRPAESLGDDSNNDASQSDAIRNNNNNQSKPSRGKLEQLAVGADSMSSPSSLGSERFAIHGAQEGGAGGNHARSPSGTFGAPDPGTEQAERAEEPKKGPRPRTIARRVESDSSFAGLARGEGKKCASRERVASKRSRRHRPSSPVQRNQLRSFYKYEFYPIWARNESSQSAARALSVAAQATQDFQQRRRIEQSQHHHHQSQSNADVRASATIEQQQQQRPEQGQGCGQESPMLKLGDGFKARSPIWNKSEVGGVGLEAGDEQDQSIELELLAENLAEFAQRSACAHCHCRHQLLMLVRNEQILNWLTWQIKQGSKSGACTGGGAAMTGSRSFDRVSGIVSSNSRSANKSASGSSLNSASEPDDNDDSCQVPDELTVDEDLADDLDDEFERTASLPEAGSSPDSECATDRDRAEREQAGDWKFGGRNANQHQVSGAASTKVCSSALQRRLAVSGASSSAQYYDDDDNDDNDNDDDIERALAGVAFGEREDGLNDHSDGANDLALERQELARIDSSRSSRLSRPDAKSSSSFDLFGQTSAKARQQSRQGSNSRSRSQQQQQRGYQAQRTNRSAGLGLLQAAASRKGRLLVNQLTVGSIDCSTFSSASFIAGSSSKRSRDVAIDFYRQQMNNPNLVQRRHRIAGGESLIGVDGVSLSSVMSHGGDSSFNYSDSVGRRAEGSGATAGRAQVRAEVQRIGLSPGEQAKCGGSMLPFERQRQTGGGSQWTLATCGHQSQQRRLQHQQTGRRAAVDAGSVTIPTGTSRVPTATAQLTAGASAPAEPAGDALANGEMELLLFAPDGQQQQQRVHSVAQLQQQLDVYLPTLRGASTPCMDMTQPR